MKYVQTIGETVIFGIWIEITAELILNLQLYQIEIAFNGGVLDRIDEQDELQNFDNLQIQMQLQIPIIHKYIYNYFSQN